MDNQEEIFDQAIDQLKKGASPEDVISARANTSIDSSEKMRPVLELMQSLLTIPKNTIPSPAKRRKYILAPVRNLWFGWLPITRFASISTAIILLFTAGVATSYAAVNSLPGGALFQLKKSAENIQLKMATNRQAKASLQVAIAEKRLSDAQKVLSNPRSEIYQKTAAISELVAQTNSSIVAVDSAVKNDALSQTNHPILASLEQVTQQQQDLLNKDNPTASSTVNSKLALESAKENVKKVADIKKYIAAAVAEQTLIKLAANPNTVTISGQLNSLLKDKIIVEKTSFLINDQTTIKDADGNGLKPADLKNNLPVSVIADKDNGQLQAKLITLLKTDSQPAVKGASDAKTASSSNLSIPAVPKIEVPSALKHIVPPTTTPEQNAVLPPTNTAQGSFIPEDPAPQAALH